MSSAVQTARVGMHATHLRSCWRCIGAPVDAWLPAYVHVPPHALRTTNHCAGCSPANVAQHIPRLRHIPLLDPHAHRVPPPSRGVGRVPVCTGSECQYCCWPLASPTSLLSSRRRAMGDSPVTRYSSSASSFAMSPSSIAKPPISAFSAIRAFLTLFGSGT
jgi:hypothetical protein